MTKLSPRYVLVKVSADMTTKDVLTAIMSAFDTDNNYKQVQRVLAIAIGNDRIIDLLDSAEDLEPLATDTYIGGW
jgi:hypothetical protein